MASFQRILVPVDGSEGSDHALALAADLARQSGGSLTVLHVVEPAYVPLPMATGQAEWAIRMADEKARGEAREAISARAAQVVGDGVDLEVVVETGYAPEVILDHVREGRHDLVVMGTHGRTGLSRVLLGSVTERVLRASKVPVLVTR